MNIAEILKYCPKDTKLYSTVFGEVRLNDLLGNLFIEVSTYKNDKVRFFEDGFYSKKGECVLFPSKNQRDWDKFRLPVKRGDIMMHPNGSFAFIASGEINPYSYPMAVCGINSLNNTLVLNSKDAWTSEFYIPASEEIKKELFDKLSEAGYKWNTDTLELEYDKEQHKLIKQEFKPFDKVLARDNETESWNADIYLKYLDDTYLRYKCASSNYRICIPYEGNEYLLGTTDFPL